MPSSSMRAFPFSTTVPTPVGVSTPPRPHPAARMRSTSVPCGTSSTSSSPESIFFCVSGLRPMWLTMVLRMTPALTSLPMPMPGSALSLAITVRPRFLWRTSSSTSRSGVPTPMKPPIITLAPSGMSSTAA